MRRAVRELFDQAGPYVLAILVHAAAAGVLVLSVQWPGVKRSAIEVTGRWCSSNGSRACSMSSRSTLPGLPTRAPRAAHRGHSNSGNREIGREETELGATSATPRIEG